jgi:NADH:ubiquinone reductase (H+-translocating)
MTSPAPTTALAPPPAQPPRVLLIGGGFGGLAAARALGGEPVRVLLCDRLNYHLFQPLLYQVALASLSATDVAVPIRSVLRGHRNIEVLLTEVVAIDRQRKVAVRAGGVEEPYDYLILAAGARTNYYGHDDWARHAPGLKDLDDALEVRRRVLLALEAAERAATEEERRLLTTFVVIGGGATGVELAGAIADLSRDILAGDFRHVRHQDTRVVLVEMAPRLLLTFPPALAERAAEQLRELRVELRLGVRVSRIDERGVWLGDELIPAATVLWGAGVSPNPLAASLGVPLDRSGRVIVGPDCAVPGHPELFVIGDMAAFTEPGEAEPLPGISPVAIQQGRSVARNIARDLRGEARVPFAYFDKGYMATIGRARAVAKLRRLELWGFPAWLAWVFVHLWFLVGFRNRIVVFLNWIWSYVMSRHGARLITGGPAPEAPQVTTALDSGAASEGKSRAGGYSR